MKDFDIFVIMLGSIFAFSFTVAIFGLVKSNLKYALVGLKKADLIVRWIGKSTINIFGAMLKRPDTTGISFNERFSDMSGNVFLVDQGRIIYRDGKTVRVKSNIEKQIQQLLDKGNPCDFKSSFFIANTAFKKEVFKLMPRRSCATMLAPRHERPLCLEHKPSQAIEWDGSIKL